MSNGGEGFLQGFLQTYPIAYQNEARKRLLAQQPDPLQEKIRQGRALAKEPWSIEHERMMNATGEQAGPAIGAYQLAQQYWQMDPDAMNLDDESSTSFLAHPVAGILPIRVLKGITSNEERLSVGVTTNIVAAWQRLKKEGAVQVGKDDEIRLRPGLSPVSTLREELREATAIVSAESRKIIPSFKPSEELNHARNVLQAFGIQPGKDVATEAGAMAWYLENAEEVERFIEDQSGQPSATGRRRPAAASPAQPATTAQDPRWWKESGVLDVSRGTPQTSSLHAGTPGTSPHREPLPPDPMFDQLPSRTAKFAAWMATVQNITAKISQQPEAVTPDELERLKELANRQLWPQLVLPALERYDSWRSSAALENQRAALLQGLRQDVFPAIPGAH